MGVDVSYCTIKSIFIQYTKLKVSPGLCGDCRILIVFVMSSSLEQSTVGHLCAPSPYLYFHAHRAHFSESTWEKSLLRGLYIPRASTTTLLTEDQSLSVSFQIETATETCNVTARFVASGRVLALQCSLEDKTSDGSHLESSPAGFHHGKWQLRDDANPSLWITSVPTDIHEHLTRILVEVLAKNLPLTF